MSPQKTSRIMIAVDGSPQALATVRYVCESVPPDIPDILIFQVISRVPEAFYDLGKLDPAWEEKIEFIRTWEQQQKSSGEEFMERAAVLFQNAGFPADRIVTRVGTADEGIARDIIREARLGYDVLALGRGRFAGDRDTPLGGVASKILGLAVAPALWLVGDKPNADNVLVAVDASANGVQCVEHAGRMLDRNNSHFLLFHAIRAVSATGYGLDDMFPERYRRLLLEDAERDMQPVLRGLERRLRDVGIDPSRISQKIVTGVSSRAAAIVNEAETGRYGTIVVGRRGVSDVHQFVMGRVTNKLTQLARKQALCIVG